MNLNENKYNKLSDLELSINLWLKLNKKRKYQLSIYLILMLLNSLAEVISIACVIPFLSVLSDPENIFKLSLVNSLSTKLGIYSPEDLRLPITLIFSSVVVISGLIKLLNLWISLRIAASIGSDLSSKVFKKIIYKPYLEYSNSSDYISILNTEIENIIYGVIIPQLQLVSSLIISISLVITLLIINFEGSMFAALITLAFYYFSIISSKNILRKNSKRQVLLGQKTIKTIQETLGLIREIILNEKYLFFIKNFDSANYKLNLLLARSSFLKTFPRILIEPFGIAVISIFGSIYISKNGFLDVLPLIGALILGIQRIIPSLQKIYEGIARTKVTRTSLILVLDLLDQPIIKEKYISKEIQNSFNNKVFKTFESIKLKNVYFRYNSDSKFTLTDVNLTINRGDRIGIIGESGSGKSTLTDLLTGLIVPTSGQILINDIPIYDNKNSDWLIKIWRKNISLVSQNIYLADSSIKNNVAFGIEKNDINLKKINKVLKLAKLEDFINSRKYGMDTLIGENGVSLSGGQCQRLSIARGLYKDSSFLLLDEATSSLDKNTEEQILNDISSIGNEITIILITHRESNLKYCNKVIRINKGKLLEIKTNN